MFCCEGSAFHVTEGSRQQTLTFYLCGIILNLLLASLRYLGLRQDKILK